MESSELEFRDEGRTYRDSDRPRPARFIVRVHGNNRGVTPGIMRAGLFTLAVLVAGAEETAPERLTEVWHPVPPIVSAPPEAPPSDAIVLFDGRNLDAWEPTGTRGQPWIVRAGALEVPPGHPGDLRTRRSFGDAQLHLEWRTPVLVQGEGQGRGNSGVFFMGLYELQVLDSYQNPTYVNGQAGAVYKEHPPLVNAARKPGEWQTYDVVFLAPRYAADGRVLRPARMTVFHNGVLVQYDVELTGPTPNGPTFHLPTLPAYVAHAARLPLMLQDHLSPVAFRNIWIRELAFPTEPTPHPTP